MAKFETKLKNMDVIRAKLKALPAKIARKILRRALREAGKTLQDEVIRRAPVGLTGNLADSIKVKDLRTEKGQVGAKVGVGAYYARFVEDGTIKMSAKPFARPAFDSTREKLVEEVDKAIAAGLEKVTNGN